ncbi:hypothetical protein QVD17_33829 [Tagetes erecta]|uniref:Uncharacterized protein n=1 Tax=Tagetes erecta TaxID=13708 RepID=A0AAD8JZ33_TARER|nr:hypothetical protein QVD17_33829 [Tagetes erecta]
MAIVKRISSFIVDHVIARTAVGATVYDRSTQRCKDRDRNPASNTNRCFSSALGLPHYCERSGGSPQPSLRAKLIACFIHDLMIMCLVNYRRGFATGTQGSVIGVVRGSGVVVMKKASEESKKSTPWVPDPVTGYYKPEGQTNQIDAAELRELLWKQKNRSN